MNKEQNYHLGEFIAEFILKGFTHSDMQRTNIEFDGQKFKFVDYADIKRISIPEDLSENTVKKMTTSLFPVINEIIGDFTMMSYFRAGFVARGGVLGDMIFSNMSNMGFNSLKYLCTENIEIPYDASSLYSDDKTIDSIVRWINFPLERMTLKNFSSLDSFNFSNERRAVNTFTRYYLDNLYLIRCYIYFSPFRNTKPQIASLIVNMALSAQHFGELYTAYGLFQKTLNLQSNISKVNSLCKNGLHKISYSNKLDSKITAFIDKCIDLELLELLWILNDLDKLLPSEIHLELKDDLFSET